MRWATGWRTRNPVAAQTVKGGDRGQPAALALRRTGSGRITAPELYPGKRLVVCRNPLLAAERARKRLELLAATEGALDEDGITRPLSPSTAC